MDESIQQIDYNMLLMNHLNRLSYIATSNFIDSINKELSEKYTNPPRTGDTALDWGTHFLYCIIPDDLVDQKFKDEQKKYLKINNNQMLRNFTKLKALINLLNRKGLLLSKQVPGKIQKIPSNNNNEVYDD